MLSLPISISQRLFRFVDVDIQIPETQLQALLPFPAPPPEHPGEVARKLVRILNKLFSSLDATWVSKQLTD